MPRTGLRIGSACLLLMMTAGCGYGEPPPNPDIRPARIGSPHWKITRRYSANRALIAEVECRDRERALEIAKAIVDPVTQAYDEVLVYVRPPDRSATRRVQWTAKGGYKILDY